VSDARSVFDRLKARGEEVFTQVSGELMKNEQFVKAMQAAMRGKERLDQAAGRALKTMNVPTRSEFKRALNRIEALEEEIRNLRARQAARPRKAAGGGAGAGGTARKRPARRPRKAASE
jgi:polyhydroxyalkanoate synthesis regulator phasin